MKNTTILLILMALLFTMIPITTAEGLLPELDDFYGVAMPSLFDTLKRYPDEQNTLQDESIQEIWHEVTDDDYSEFGDYLSKSGCNMVSYSVEGNLFSAEVEKEGKSFFFSYDNGAKLATLVYPKGTFDGKMDEVERTYQQAIQSYTKGDIVDARHYFWQVGRKYKDSNSYLSKIEDYSKGRFILEGLIFGIKPDGTVFVALDGAGDGANRVEKWNDIIDLSATYHHTIGLKKDGTVIATGVNRAGACNVRKWKDIIQVSANGWQVDDEVDSSFSVGLKSDGTLVATGYNGSGQCNIQDWTNIVAIYTMPGTTIGLTKNSTVVTTNEKFKRDVENWDHVMSIFYGRDSSGSLYFVGLKDDGTVVAAGGFHNIQVAEWSDIISIAIGEGHIVGLKSDGTVVASGLNNQGQCEVDRWEDIVDIAAGEHHTIGLKADGTVIATGDNSDGQCNVNNWTDIVAIDAYSLNSYGIKSNGTIVASGWNKTGRCNVQGWDLWNEWETDILNEEIAIDSMDENGETVRNAYETLKQGSKGDAVVKLQKALIAAGALSGKADGDFGRLTEDAVKQMQTEYGMEATGIADEKFQNKLYGD